MTSFRSPERRAILRGLVVGSAVVAAALAGMFPIVTRKQARLRPPGALVEKDFLAACIKCGQCVQVCPVKAIRLADVADGYGLGVPYIPIRDQACDFSCDALQCILACPTGALSHALSRKEDVRMGKAMLVGPQTCLARLGKGFKGLARGQDHDGLHRYVEIDRWKPIRVAEHPYDLEICDLCVRECPVENAISLRPVSDDPADLRRTPMVHAACVGCGMCEMICPTETPSIAVAPLTYWRTV
ncbi:MAG: 4Fe-4S dicluster domain-containing protein [Bacteroidota bacterium]